MKNMEVKITKITPALSINRGFNIVCNPSVLDLGALIFEKQLMLDKFLHHFLSDLQGQIKIAPFKEFNCEALSPTTNSY